MIIGSTEQYVEEQQHRLVASVAAILEERARADAASSARTNFLALVSHELRTPLTPVLLGASVLCSDESLSPGVRRIARVIAHNAKLEAAFIDGLLGACRLTRGRLSLKPAGLNVHECLAAAIEAARPEFDGKNLQLEVALASHAPRISGDAARLRRAFATLLRNAANVSRDGERSSSRRAISTVRSS